MLCFTFYHLQFNICHLGFTIYHFQSSFTFAFYHLRFHITIYRLGFTIYYFQTSFIFCLLFTASVLILQFTIYHIHSIFFLLLHTFTTEIIYMNNYFNPYEKHLLRYWPILARSSILHFAGAVNTRQKITVHIINLVYSEFPNRSCRSVRSFISTLDCT